ncbi:MAG: YceI family protein [Saprospiraceae bacterium]|nr:YceI family protein [Lewinella sp.]
MQKRIQILVLLLLGLGYLQAQESYQLRSAEIAINGTSSLHDWVSTTTKITASGDLTIEGGTLVDVSSLQLTIPVKSITSEKGKIMDNKTYNALLSDQYPNITFKLQDVKSIEPEGTGLVVKASGALTIAGKTKTIEIIAKAQADAKGNYRFTGKKALKMTDFGVDPPTALLGTLKTGDDITINFDLNLAKAENEN